MAREHWNDVPGDIAGSDADNLPGGFGTENPDNSTDATVDEVTDNDVRGPSGDDFSWRDVRGGMTSGTGYAEAADDGATVDPAELLEGEEAHPGAAVGYTGAEPDKRGPAEAPSPNGTTRGEDE